MDFDDLPSIFIQHRGIVREFFTSCRDISEFVLSLRHHFGADAVPDNKEIFLATEDRRTGPDGQLLPPREAPLSLFLEKKANSDRIFTLKFSDAKASQLQSQPQETRPQAVNGTCSPKDPVRAAKVKKGRVINKGVDKDGAPLSKQGQNTDDCLTHDERVEMEKYILYYWKVDEQTGIPLNQRNQPDQALVDLSIYEMQKNPILKTRPERVLRRQAQKRVSEIKHAVFKSGKQVNPYKPALNMLRLKAEGFVLGKSHLKIDTNSKSAPLPSSNLKFHVPLSNIDENQSNSRSRKRGADMTAESQQAKKAKGSNASTQPNEKASEDKRRAGSETEKHERNAPRSQKKPTATPKALEHSLTSSKAPTLHKGASNPEGSSDAVNPVDTSSEDESSEEGTDSESEADITLKRRARQPSAKVKANEELAAEAAKLKSKKGEPRVTKAARQEARRLGSRAMKEQAAAKILQSLGEKPPDRSRKTLFDLDTAPLAPPAPIKPFNFPDDGADAVTICPRNFQSLDPGEELHDDIVDFHARFLLLAKLSCSLASEVYLLNAFVYKKLQPIMNMLGKCNNTDELFKSPLKWVKEDILRKRCLLLPICDGQHWSLIAVMNPGGKIDSKNDPYPEQKPCIVHFNSIPGTHEDAVDFTRMYLSELHLSRNVPLRPPKRTAPIRPFKESSMPTIIPKVPVQDNTYDCGLFTLQYIEEILAKLPFNVDVKKKSFPIEDMIGVDKTRFEQETVERKRDHIRKLIRLLSRAVETGHLQAPFKAEDLIQLYEEAMT